MKKLLSITATFGLTAKQASMVAFLGAFVTVIGAVALAYWFRRQNRKAYA